MRIRDRIAAWLDKPKPKAMPLWMAYAVTITMFCGMDAATGKIAGASDLVAFAKAAPALSYWYAMLTCWQRGLDKTWMFFREAAILSLVGTGIAFCMSIGAYAALDEAQLAAISAGFEAAIRIDDGMARAYGLTSAAASFLGHATIQAVFAFAEHAMRNHTKR